MKKRVLTAAEIFICKDLHRVWVPTPEWTPADTNGDECGVYVTTLDARQKEKWETDLQNMRNEGTGMASALALSCVTETGDRVFTTQDIEKIADHSGLVVGRLWQVFRALNIVTDTDVSELVKNS